MNEPLDEMYLRWLYSQVGSIRTRIKARTYWQLFRQLYTTEFVWFVPNDDNRVMDGRLLRDDFCRESGLEDVDENWMNLGCSFLEMLIALSRRLSFESLYGGEPRDWFWQLIRNIELEDQNDSRKIAADEVAEKVNTVIWRTYKPNGIGGLFPLANPHDDQREREIWYQMSDYFGEMQ